MLIEQQVVIIEFEDEWDLPCVLGSARLDKAKRSGISITSCVEREPEMVQRVVRRRIGREASGRTMLETLVYGQNHQPPGSREAAVVEEARNAASHSGIFRSVITEDLSHPLTHHCLW